jgi:mevalonate kinase
VINGAESLAIPFHQFSGQFVHELPKAERNPDFEEALLKLRDFIQKDDRLAAVYELSQIDAELEKDLYFESNIPIGYGLGSSGCLTAAFYDRFAKEKTSDLSDLKNILARTESCFHGTSSGLDPLVCYLNKAIHIHGDQIDSVQLADLNLPMVLLNSNQSRNTWNLVGIFKDKLLNPEFKEVIENTLAALNNSLISGYVQDAHLDVQKLEEFSRLQFQFFPEMIPAQIARIWQEGLDQRKWLLKLCGAGGGGFFQVFLLQEDGVEELKAAAQNFPILEFSAN